eukprot:TRINITY_DN2874_c0_g1_i1.p1 TRINITY_DN2874_c0_g1~~TRINITY_DN2874_c0_g1_i1.p1  ORF type:complete len:496 (+),score=110.70 TRINITY_DN2874_c0_g1_i1:186-1673(+)
MENPMDLSFIPPWRYVWDELKHALFMMLVSLTLLYYFPYTFALLSAILVNLAYYVSRMVLSDVPRLIYNPANPHTAAILSKCPMIFRKFFPTMWAWGAKVQTGMFAIWPFPLWVLRGRVEYHRELLSLEDGGTCALDWFVHPALRQQVQSLFGTVVYEAGSNADIRSPIVMVLSGVVGQVSNLYVKRLVMYIHKLHPTWRIVVKSWRGIGVKLTSPRPETWGSQAVDDLHHCVGAVVAKYPEAPLLGVGFSFGGQILASYMGAYAADAAFTAGVSISSLFEVNQVTTHVEGTIYDWLNTSHLISHLQNDLPWIASAIGSDEINLGGEDGIRAYHDQVTNKFMKQENTEQLIDYMTEHALENAKKVTAPLLCFMADDDPLCPLGSYDRMLNACRESPGIVVVQTKRGGHCGWFHGLTGKSWLDSQVVNFLAAALETSRADNSVCLTQAIASVLDVDQAGLQGLQKVDDMTLSLLLNAVNGKLRDNRTAAESEPNEL